MDIVTLDLGTTKFCISTLSYIKRTNTFQIKALSTEALGMKRGMVADINLAKQQLHKLIEMAEKEFLVDIRKVVVGIAGSHLRSFNSKTSLLIAGIQPKLKVTSEVLNTLNQQAEDDFKHEAREVLHCVPLSYVVDHRPATQSPVGLSGEKITGSYLVIDADRAYLKDVIALCNQSGLEVTKFFAEPFASASVTLDDQVKKNGSVLIDIGGGTSDGLIFHEGLPVYAFTVDIGGYLMTRDISLGLRLSMEEAEKVKFYFGISANYETNILEVKNLNGNSSLISWKDVFPILAPRIDELSTHIQKELRPFLDMIPSGIFLTGGGSYCKGLAERIENKLKIDTKLLNPDFKFLKPTINQSNAYTTNCKFESNIDLSARYSTVLGLINLEIGRRQVTQSEIPTTTTGKYLYLFKNWLKEMNSEE